MYILEHIPTKYQYIGLSKYTVHIYFENAYTSINNNNKILDQEMKGNKFQLTKLQNIFPTLT